MSDTIIRQIRTLTDLSVLHAIIEAARRQLLAAARLQYKPGAFALADFKTRGVHAGVIVGAGQKHFSIVLLGPPDGLPRRSRQWRVDVGLLSPVPSEQLPALQAEAEKLRREQPYLFDGGRG